MADYDPGERRASAWGCGAGIAGLVALFAAVAAALYWALRTWA